MEEWIFEHWDNLKCKWFWSFIIKVIELPCYFRYLFAKADNPDFCSWWERLKCRIKHHPCGCIYYNPSGFEPDGRCQNCGDEIG